MFRPVAVTGPRHSPGTIGQRRELYVKLCLRSAV